MNEIFFIMGIMFLAMMVPGPDMMLIMRYALSPYPKTAAFCIFGVCAGLCIHVALALVGVSALIASGGFIYAAAKIIGAAYLVYIGYRIYSAPVHMDSVQPRFGLDRRAAFRHGFFTNVLNPKVMMFILALFTQIINPAEPLQYKLLIIVLLLATEFITWSSFAFLIQRPAVYKSLKKYEHQINVCFGLLLISFGIILGVTP